MRSRGRGELEVGEVGIEVIGGCFEFFRCVFILFVWVGGFKVIGYMGFFKGFRWRSMYLFLKVFFG